MSDDRPRELDRKPVPPPERAILRDLIEELWEWAGHEALNPDTEQRMYRMAASAEARLKEINND